MRQRAKLYEREQNHRIMSYYVDDVFSKRATLVKYSRLLCLMIQEKAQSSS